MSKNQAALRVVSTPQSTPAQDDQAPHIRSTLTRYQSTNRLMRELDRLVSAEWNDISAVQAFILFTLFNGSTRPGALAIEFGSATQTITGTLDRLEKCGYIERHHDTIPHDRRGVQLTITPKLLSHVGGASAFIRRFDELCCEAEFICSKEQGEDK